MNGEEDSGNCDHVIRAHQLCMELNNIMMLINSSHDVEEILHEIVEESCKAIGCESARIAMREGNLWIIRYVNNFPEELIGQSFSDENLPHAALAMITKRPVAIDDAFHDARTNRAMMKSLEIKSVLVLPLMEAEVVIGTLHFDYHSKAVSFTEIEIDYAGRVATGVSIALQNARLYQDLQRTENELKQSNKLGEALNEIDTILYSARDYDSIMESMLRISTEAIGAETAMIFSKEDNTWITRYVYKLSQSLVGRSFSDSEVLHTTITAGTQRSIVVTDTSHSNEVNQEFVRMLGIRSLLDFPLIVKGEVIGDLTFHYHSSPIPFNDIQVEFVRKLQNSISLALNLARLRDVARQSETRLKEAEKMGKFGYFHYDIGTCKLAWSEGMFHIFGRDQSLGEPTVDEFFGFYSVDPGREAMRELVRKEEPSEFDATLKRDDETFSVHITVRSHKDDSGNVLAHFGTIQDITERKLAEQQLRESETFKQIILDSVPAHIAVLDRQGIILAVNRAWIQFAESNGLPDAGPVCAGADYQAVCRKAAEMSDPLAVEALAGIEEVLMGKSCCFTLDYPCHSPTLQRWFMMKVVRANEMGGAVVTHLDITDRIKAENALQHANHELKTFNYTVAHDLRKPLTIVNGYCQAIRELCGDQLTEECSAFLREAYEGTLRMNKLIDALMRFSGLAHAEPKREPVNLCAVAAEVAAELKLAEPERRVDFRITKGITAEGDPELLRVVLANLLGNAWKYTSNREEAIIEFGTGQISGRRGRAYFVRDNGLGFNPEEASRLFAPFQRLQAGKEVGGMGIGLATVARIIQRHGGEVWAEGEPGKGATFYFSLPAG